MVGQKGKRTLDPCGHEATTPVRHLFCVRAIHLYLTSVLHGSSATCSLVWPKRMVALRSHQERYQQKGRLLRVLLWDYGAAGGHCPDTGQVLRTSFGKDGIPHGQRGDNKAGTTPLTFLTGTNSYSSVTNHLKWPSSPPPLCLLPLHDWNTAT